MVSAQAAIHLLSASHFTPAGGCPAVPKRPFQKVKELTGLGMLSRTLKAWSLAQPRLIRRAVVMSIDLLLLLFIMALLIRIRMVAGPAFKQPAAATLAALAALPFISVAALYVTGVYQLVTRHIGRKGIWRIGYAQFIALAAWAFLLFLLEWRGDLMPLPRTVVAAYFVYGWIATWMVREFAGWWLRDQPLDRAALKGRARKRVLIYGADEHGVALLQFLQGGGKYDVRGFLAHSRFLHGMKIDGLPVHGLRRLETLLAREKVEEIIISTERLTPERRRRLVRHLVRFPVRVRIVAEPMDFFAGRGGAVDLKDIDVDDLLGRDTARPVPELMRANITGKTVMVTGAGGSIGSEIARRAFSLKPRELILFELSELALYRIEQELADMIRAGGDGDADTPR
ncbi:MAG TPA: hypothetical protein ENK15_01390, partial [Thermopetrobacter sp.]|nr:hypothetical protein [Thermopetrobacter sp.]